MKTCWICKENNSIDSLGEFLKCCEKPMEFNARTMSKASIHNYLSIQFTSLEKAQAFRLVL